MERRWEGEERERDNVVAEIAPRKAATERRGRKEGERGRELRGRSTGCAIRSRVSVRLETPARTDQERERERKRKRERERRWFSYFPFFGTPDAPPLPEVSTHSGEVVIYPFVSAECRAECRTGYVQERERAGVVITPALSQQHPPHTAPPPPPSPFNLV